MVTVFFVLALPIFPGGLPPSIFGAEKLNYRVRDGNGWTLFAINTNYVEENLARKNPSLYHSQTTAHEVMKKVGCTQALWYFQKENW